MFAKVSDYMQHTLRNTVRRAPLLSLFALIGLLALMVTGLAAVTDWPQFQSNAQHSGALGDVGNGFTAPDAHNLRWSVKTGGAVRASAAILHRAVKLAADAQVDDATITVDDATGLQAGDLLTIGGDFLGAITGINGTQVTMSGTVTAAHTTGSDVLLSRQYRLQAAAKVGDSTLAVNNTELFAAGDRLTLINKNDVTQREIVTITDVNGLSLEITPVLANAYPVDSFLQVTGVSAKLAEDITNATIAAGVRTYKVDNPERFVVGDRVWIGNEARTVSAVSQRYSTLTFDAVPAVHAKDTVIATRSQYISDMALLGSDDGYLYALDPDSGRVYWKTSANQYLGAIHGTPVIDKSLGHIYVTTVPGRLFAFNLQGEYLWAYPKLSDPCLGAINASPVLDDSGNVYFTSDGGVKRDDGTYTPAGIYKVAADGTASGTFTLPASVYPGGLALYNDGGNVHVVFGTRSRSAESDLLTEASGASSVKVAHPERFANGQKVQLLHKNIPTDTTVTRQTQGLTITDVNAVDGTVTFQETITGTYPAGSTLQLDATETMAMSAEAGQVYQLDASLSATPQWIYPRDCATHPTVHPITAMPVVDVNGVIYVGDQDAASGKGSLHVISGTGTVPTAAAWAPKMLDGQINEAGAVTADGSSLYIGTAQGTVYLINTADGADIATYGIGKGALSAPLTLSGGKVLAATEQGYLTYLQPDQPVPPLLLQPVWQWDALTGAGMPTRFPIHTAPTLANGAGYQVVIVGSDDGRIYGIGDPLATGDAPVEDTTMLLPLPYGSWPFFHHDARRQGSLFDLLNLSEPGPLQPTLRWFAAQDSPLRTSPVVTDHTPDGVTRVYIGSDDGRIYAYDASTGAAITRNWPATGYVQLPGAGPVRATPAVSANGDIAVTALDGHLYLISSTGVLSPANGIPLGEDDGNANTNHSGNAVASPAFNNTGSIVYTATMESLDDPAQPNPGAPRMTQVGDDLIYTFTQPTTVSRIRIYTKDAGTLMVYRRGDKTTLTADAGIGTSTLQVTNGSYFTAGDAIRLIKKSDPTVAEVASVETVAGNTLTLSAPLTAAYPTGSIVEFSPAYTSTFDQVTDTPHYLNVELDLDAERIVWTSDTAPQGFKVYTAGTVSDTALPVTYTPATTFPFTGLKLTGAFATTYVHHLTITTKSAGKLTLIDGDGYPHVWQYLTASDTEATITVPVQRAIAGVIWESTAKDAGGLQTTGTVTNLQLYSGTFDAGSGHVYAYKADGTLKWQYPDDGTGLAPITASPVVAEVGGNDAVYVATTTGQVLALQYDETIATVNVLWSRQTFAPIVASPVLADNPNGADLFVTDSEGGLHLLHGATGKDIGGWPTKLPGAFSNSAAVTAGGHAYLVSDNGSVYLLNLGATVLNDDDFSVTDGATGAGVVLPSAPPVSANPQTGAVTFVTLVKPTFTSDSQHIDFGLCTDAARSSALLLLRLTSTGQLTVVGNPTSAVSLSGMTAAGVELAVTINPTGAGTALATAAYRLPDATGSTAGSFVQFASIPMTLTVNQLYPYLRAFSTDNSTYAARAERMALYHDPAYAATAFSPNPMVGWLNSLPTAVYSSPAIDSAGRVYFGSEAGALYCLEPRTGKVQWAYTPDRSVISTSLTKAIDSNAGTPLTISVASIAGYRIGDHVRVTRPDGSVPDDLGRVTSIGMPANPQTTLQSAGPLDDGTGHYRKFLLSSVDDITVGDDVAIQPSYDGQYLVAIGKVVSVDATAKAIVVDQDVPNVSVTATATNTAGSNQLTFTDAIPQDIVAGQRCYITSAPGTVYHVQQVNAGALTVTLSSTIATAHDTEWTFLSNTGMATSNNPDNLNELQFTALPPGIAEHELCYLSSDPTKQYEVEAFDDVANTVTLTDPAPTNATAVEWTFVPYPADSQLVIGSLAGTLIVSKAPASARAVGDRVSVVSGVALPMRTSPAIGPAQTVYLGADDGVLYAIGPQGPAGVPSALPIIPAPTDLTYIWNTFHADNQRTGYANRPGPRTKDLRWYRDTGSTLESSPALGYADATAPLGVLYAGTVDESGSGEYYAPRGSLLSINASSGRVRWRFDDDGNMGKIYSSPTVFSATQSDVAGNASGDESIVFGTVDAPRDVTGYLTEDTPMGTNIYALSVQDPSEFQVGMQVYISDPDSGKNFEVLGVIGKIDPVQNLLIFVEPHVTQRDHVAGSKVILQVSQQGHLYCVDRSGALRWKFPQDDATAQEYMGAVHSSPVVDSNGVIYFGTDDGVIYAIDQDGTERWHYMVALPNNETGVPVITGSPALDKDGNRLFIGVSVTRDSGVNQGYLLALDTLASSDDKRVLWIRGYEDRNGNAQQDAGEPLFQTFTASPMLTTVDSKDRLFIGTEDQDSYIKGVFYSIDPDTGSVIARRSQWPDVLTAPDGTGTDFGGITSTAAAVPESSTSVMTGSAVSADGTRITVGDTSKSGLRTGLRVKVFADDQPTQTSTLVGVGATELQLDPPLTGDWTAAKGITVQTDEQLILVGTLDGQLLAFGGDLTPRWRFTRSLSGINTSPAIATYTDPITNVHSYTVYFGSNDHYLYAVNFIGDTYALAWSKDLRDRLYASPVVGMPTHTGGRAILYQASRDHYIYAFGDQTNYDGDAMNPNGPDQPPATNPDDILVPSTLSLTKSVERYNQTPPGAPVGDDGTNWWKFTVHVRNDGRGLVDKVRVFDTLPDTLASSTPPVPGTLLADEAVGVSRPVAFSGSAGTLNDMASLGKYTGTTVQTYYVKIAEAPGAGGVDTFEWSNDGTTWNAPTAITGGLQNIGTDDVQVAFAKTTGHTINTQWKFTVDPDKESWELMWTDKATNDGFSLNPDQQDPKAQPNDWDFQRTFVFYVKVKPSDDPYTNPGPNSPKFWLGDPDYDGKAKTLLPEYKLGEQLQVYMQYYAPVNATQGINQLTAEGLTYNGVHDDQHAKVVRAHKETPVQNDWTSDFRVRLYYNGYVDKADDSKLAMLGNTTDHGTQIHAFSLWNQLHPETGEPLVYTIDFPVTITSTESLSDNSHVITGTVKLDPTTAKAFMPYAWRATIQQCKARLNTTYLWGKEWVCEQHLSGGRGEWEPDFLIANPIGLDAGDHTLLCTVKSSVTNANQVPVTVVTQNLQKGQWVYIDNRTQPDTLAYVKDVNAGVLQLAQAVSAEVGASIYNVTGKVEMGDGYMPAHIATSPTVRVSNISKWLTNAYYIQSRIQPFVVTPIDLRNPAAKDWNSQLTANAGYTFGASPQAGRLWDGFRYDPYRENHLRFDDTAIDLPHGAALLSGQSVDVHFTRPLPAHQPASDVGSEYATMAEQTGNTLDGKTVTRDSDGRWIVTVDGTPVSFARSLFETRAFLDLNTNGVWDVGEPYYSIPSNALTDPTTTTTADLIKVPLGQMATRMGIAPVAGMQVSEPVLDLGNYARASGYPLLPPLADLLNTGNRVVTGVGVQGSSYVTTTAKENTTTVTTLSQDPGVLHRTDTAATKYDGTLLTLRPRAEIQPMDFFTQTGSNWMLPKSPAGSTLDYGRQLSIALPGINYRQPTGTYSGTMVATGSDLENNSSVVGSSAMVNVRVSESLFSMVEPGVNALEPRPAFDAGVGGTWKNYLSGAESWPTAAVLPGMKGDLGVWVSSNTPSLNATEITPKADTDTNIWFRRTKHLVSDVSAISGNAGTLQLTLPVAIAQNVRDDTHLPANADLKTNDLIILRNKRTRATDPADVWYGDAQDVTGGVVTAKAFDNQTWTHPASDTVVEILAHPWLPVLDDTALEDLRTALADPGVAGDTGPHPIRLTTPSATEDGKWLVWTVSAARTMTHDGKKDVVPFSYLAYKAFSADAPQGGVARWVASAKALTARDAVTLTMREKPVMLTDVTATLKGLVLYEGGTDTSRGLYYAYTTGDVDKAGDTTWRPDWRIDNPLTVINNAFSGVGRPQAWVETVKVNGTDTTKLNLVFQGRRADGNTDLYYARFTVSGTTLTLDVPDRDPVTDTLTANADHTVFSGGNNLAWSISDTAHKLKLVVNDTTTIELPAQPDTQPQYEVVSGAYRLQVDPYANTVRVLNGKVTKITVTGVPRVQRLTTNVAADVNPTISIERWRYLNDDQTHGGDPTLATSPRIWIFWTRQHEDGLGTRAYYRTYRADTEKGKLNSEERGEGADTLNVDMPERMLPMSIFAPDSSIFITRQSPSLAESADTPEAGLWVLSTATRSIFPPYPNLGARTAPMQHDLFLQVLNVPVPDK